MLTNFTTTQTVGEGERNSPQERLANRERGALASALRSSSLFQQAEPGLLSDLEAKLQPVMLQGGEALFHKREPGDSLYLVVNGRLRADALDGEEKGREFGPGDLVGESSVIGRAPRSDTVSAVRDSFLGKLCRADFEDICTRHTLPAVLFFTRKLIEIEHNSEHQAQPSPRTIALVPSHHSVDLNKFARQLAACLGSGSRKVLLLNREKINRALGIDSAGSIFGGSHDAHLVTWLNTKEREYDCVVYQTDYEAGPWTTRSLRQADHILLVADAKRTPRPECFKSLAFAKGQPTSLALVHASGAKPSGTSNWLNAYPFERHYHLHEGDTSDFLRLSRCLSRSGIGVVLGGGFARGVAHLGVLRALSELKVPIDAIGGTSMGALISALYLCGHKDEKLFRLLLEHGKSALHDFTFPMVALLSGRKVREILEPLVGEQQIEDLWLPAFFVATNLTRGCIEVLDRGSLLEALLASSRVPGMFPPVVRGNELLVDGGLVNNVPVDVMTKFCPGSVVAVNVSPDVDFKADTGVTSDASGWKLLRDRANPFGEGLEWPSIFSVLMRTMTFNSQTYIKHVRELADLYLTPPTAEYGFNDFDRGPEMAKQAYDYARPRIAHWVKRRAGRAFRAEHKHQDSVRDLKISSSA